MNILHSDGFTRPYGGRRETVEEPVDIVCVDGSPGADRAMETALRQTPPDHRLLLLNGAYVPHSEELAWGSYRVSSLREGHYWDKDMPDVYTKYTDMCQQAGRKCDFVHFHFNSMNKFGERVCSFAKHSKAQSIILARRRKDERNVVGRMLLGSGSQAVVNQCPHTPITLVTARPPLSPQSVDLGDLVVPPNPPE